MALVKCVRCGAKINKSAAICPHCGGNVRDKSASMSNCKTLDTYKTLLNGGIITPQEYMQKEKKILQRQQQEVIRQMPQSGFKPFQDLLNELIK